MDCSQFLNIWKNMLHEILEDTEEAELELMELKKKSTI